MDCGYNLDHGVLAVGFDSKAKVITVKNSWAVSWGWEGYITMSMMENGTPGMCGRYMQASYPTA